jgi:hypothetical protein
VLKKNKKMLKYKDFISEKMNNDDVLDLYNYFIRILLIHENYFYKENRISKDINFRNDINKVFHKMILGKKPFTEELYNKVSEYERKLYNDSKMTPDDNFGCSIWDVCDVILEDPDTLNINRYIQDFSENDIYVYTNNPYNSDDINTTISGLDKISDSLIGKKVIWKGKEYTIVDKHNDSDFVMIDDENNSVIGLHWNDVELVD